MPAAQVIRAYPAEVTALAESPAEFAVLAHINYAAGTGPSARASTATPISRASTARRCARSPAAAAACGYAADAQLLQHQESGDGACTATCQGRDNRVARSVADER